MTTPSRSRLALAVLASGLLAGAGDAVAADPVATDGRKEQARTRQAGLEGFDSLVRVTRPAGPVLVGADVSIMVTISSLRPVGHAPFHLRFDPAVLRFESAEEGGFLSAGGAQTAFLANTTSAGDAVVIGLSRLGRGQGVAGDGTLCRLRFTAVGPGDAALTFARASIRDGHNRELDANFVPSTLVVEE